MQPTPVNRSQLERQDLQHALLDACIQDIRAFKPGNVSLGFPAHDMDAQDFILSAHAVAQPMTEEGASVGQRIEQSIQATRRVVSCNTNLGIVLLFAPVFRAVDRMTGAVTLNSLKEALQIELDNLTLEDAQACYRAISIAAPSGLGESEEQEVLSEPTRNLREVMHLAAKWDQIGYEYDHGYEAIFEQGVSALLSAQERGLPELWAITQCFLTFVAHHPDTHVSRRHGVDVAQGLQQEAQTLLDRWNQCCSAEEIWPHLLETDQRWKKNKINPGTSADLVVTSILIMRLITANSYNGRRH
jgi:triphosphoribosyl-dephospho-CoA synthase